MGWLSSLDPTGNDFLGMGKIPGRIAGDLFTGGLGEFGRSDSFGLPPSLATALKIGGGTIGGSLLGGPAGAFAGGTLGGMLGGNTTGGMAGGGIGALMNLLGGGGGSGGGLGGLQGALGGSLLGLGLAKNTDIKDPQFPNAQNDLATIGQQQQAQQGIFGQGLQQQQGLNQQALGQGQNLLGQSLGQQRGMSQDYLNQLQGINTTQNDLLGQRMQSQRDQLLSQLTTGPEGEAFREKYNDLGLLNSGAFNTGLANQFGNLASQQQQDILNQGIAQQQQLGNAAGQGYQNLSGLGAQGYGNLQGIGNQGFQNLSSLTGQGTGVQSELGLGGLQRQLGLEDTQTQYGISKALQDARNSAAEKQSLIGTGGYLLGGGAGQQNINVGGGGAGGGGGGGGGLLSQLSSLFPSLLSGIGGLFGGGGGGGGPATGDPNLDLYAGGNPFGGGLPGGGGEMSMMSAGSAGGQPNDFSSWIQANQAPGGGLTDTAQSSLNQYANAQKGLNQFGETPDQTKQRLMGLTSGFKNNPGFFTSQGDVDTVMKQLGFA